MWPNGHDPFGRLAFPHFLHSPHNHLSPRFSPLPPQLPTQVPHARTPRHHHRRRRRSLFALDVSGSDCSADDAPHDQCFLDTDAETRHAFFADPRPKHSLDDELQASLKRVSVMIPAHTADDFDLRRERDTVLILPQLTRLKIGMLVASQMRGASPETSTLHVAVASSMRIRDVVKQILPPAYTGDVRIWVKFRGEWQEPGGGWVISDVEGMGRFARNENGECEVRVVLGADTEVREGRVGRGGRDKAVEKGWEMRREWGTGSRWE